MPLTARMSLWGLYQYDSTILDGLTVPTGMDGDNVKQNLLLETAGLSILYPDPDFLKAAITVWAAERQDVWDKMYATTVAQYNPMENYDRIEETEEQTSGISVKENKHSMEASSSDESTNVSTRNGSNESVSSNTAYNSNDFADTAKAVSSGQDNASNTGRSKGSTSENGTDKGNESRNDNRTIRSRIHGNIGVRSGQELIMQSREVDIFCMTEFIINDFIQRFCVMVY